jgi:hypothetical protein
MKHQKDCKHTVRTRFGLRVDGVRRKFGSMVASTYEMASNIRDGKWGDIVWYARIINIVFS